MKKFFALSTIALLSTSAFASDPITQQTVHIAGEVVAQTCTLDSRNQFIMLEKITLNDLKAGQDNTKEFSIKLTGCNTKSSESVFVAFDNNSPNITDAGNLKNTLNGGNAGSGVQIKITKTDNTKINLKNADEVKSNAILQRRLVNGEAEFKFKAGYISENSNEATGGLVSSSIPVTIQYQ